MKDLLKDIIETSRDRIKTPITGSFITAFIIYNWRPLIYLLFSNASIENKIEHINSKYCDFWAIIGPLTIALVYITAVPYIMMGLEKFTKTAVTGRKTHKTEQLLFDLDKQKDISIKEFQIESIKNGQKEISDLHDKITSLNNHIDNQNSQHKTQIENYENLVLGYKNNESNLKDSVSKLQKIIFHKNESKNTRGITDINIIQKLSLEEQNYYLDFCKKHLLNKKIEIPITPGYINKFFQLELISNEDIPYKITRLGLNLFYYLNDNMPLEEELILA